MKSQLQVPLNASPEQQARLKALQRAFSDVCNALAPMVRETRCWNRVALHHMAYRSLRDKFPQMGSQMVCNAIYSVSRTARAVYQSAASPFNLERWGNRRLALIQFEPSAPVYFDRHTLSLKSGHLSMYTLDGRIRFDLQVQPEDEARFHNEKLNEVVLTSAGDSFRLLFTFSRAGSDARPDNADATELPEYVIVLPDPAKHEETGEPA